MREIKFRAWEPLNEKMIYFDGFIPFQIGERYIEGALNAQNQEKKYLTTMNFNAIEVMQYINLNDINNKEIYELDIAKVPAGYGGDNYYPEQIGIVRYEYNGYEIISINENDYILQDFVFSEIEIIGNVFSSPEVIHRGEI